MELELRHLHTVVTVAEAGSISDAARVLGVAQPNLTRLLQRIEEMLGGRLYVRSPSGVELTAFGHKVTTRARTILDLAADLGRLAQHDTAGDPLRIRTYACRLDDIRPWLPSPIRDRPWDAHQYGTPEAGVDAIRAGTADVFWGIHWPHAPWPATDGVTVVEPLRFPMQVMIAASHPLAARP